MSPCNHKNLRGNLVGNLRGNNVSLEKLSYDHFDGLYAAIEDGELWKIRETIIPHPDQLERFFELANAGMRRGKERVYAIIDLNTGQVAGSTRFREINIAHKKAVIGPTFLGRSWQRTHVNTEAKYLMLKHAFESMGLNRIELLCDVLNTRSRKAITRLGAKEEGIIRQHLIMPDGRIRDSVIHSILRQEWPAAKISLEQSLWRNKGKRPAIASINNSTGKAPAARLHSRVLPFAPRSCQ